jgi:hypothetical protein
MVSNFDIKAAFYAQVRSFADDNNIDSIIWDASVDDQDGIAKWIEVNHRPNDYDPFLSDQRNVKRGFFTLTYVIRRTPTAESELVSFEGLVQSEWPKTTVIYDNVQTTATPAILGTIERRDTAITLSMNIPYEE